MWPVGVGVGVYGCGSCGGGRWMGMPNMIVDVLGSIGPWNDAMPMVMVALSYRLMVMRVSCGMRAVLFMVTLKNAMVPNWKVSLGYPV